jgi:hypothetical protein
MADLYGTGGINDTSLLSGPNAQTARQVQQAFVNSNNARLRASMRYSLPELANFNEDNALAQAQTAAGLINQNQNLHDVIDASKATPHGVAQNLAAYLPLLGAGNALASTLFGRSGGGALAEKGIVGVGQDLWNKIVHPGSGTTYQIDAQGNLVSPGFDPNSASADATWPNTGSWPTNYGATPDVPDWRSTG